MEIDIDLMVPNLENMKEVNKGSNDYHKANDITFLVNTRDPHLNPYKIKDKVNLLQKNAERYKYIQKLDKDEYGIISDVIGKKHVNIMFFQTRPTTIKTVPISDVVIYKKEKLLTKLRVKLMSYKIVQKLLKKIWRNK